MDRSIAFIIVFIVLTSVAYYFWQEHEAEKVLSASNNTAVEIPLKPEITVSPEPRVRYPVPDIQEEVIAKEEPLKAEPVVKPDPLPGLDESDAPLTLRLQQHYALEKLQEILVLRELVRHLVVTIDNLDGRKLAKRHSVVRSPGQAFMVIKQRGEEEYLLDPENHNRYQIYMDFLNAISDQQMLSIYVRFYPLFQQAYEELGYPDRYFNDRLIEIIDHLLGAPIIKGDIKLVRPKVYYQFTDTKLEELSAGQKILIRIGSKNALQVRGRLNSLRKLLTTLGTR